jgi:hypothetical protein
MRQAAVAIICFAVFFVPQAKNDKGTAVKPSTVTSGHPNNADNSQQQLAASSLGDKGTPTVACNQQIEFPVCKPEAPQINNEQENTGKLAKYTYELVWVGVLQGIVLFGTLLAIKHEAKIAKDIAAAAAKNAAALMLGDRAWVLIQKTTSRDRIQSPYLPTAEQMMSDNRLPHCIFYLKNYGKTPAKMIAWKYELQIGDSPNAPPDITVYNMTNNMPVFTPDMLPQASSIAQQVSFRTWSGPQEFVDVHERRKFLWLCGTVQYFDTFERGEGSEHETVFCYLWELRMNVPGWISAGPREYHKAT